MHQSQQDIDADVDKPYYLPEDKDQLILQWDLSGGFRAPDLEGFQRQPNLRIYADGRVIAGVNSPEYKLGKTKLSPEQLKELLDFIVVEQKFFATSEADIRRHMEGYRSRLADGLTSTLQIELRDQQQSIAVYATSVTARDFKDYAPIQRLKAIEKKLRDTILFAKAGGDSGLEEILQSANDELKLIDPAMEKFEATDISSITPRTDGSLLASISGKKNGKNVFATVQRAAESDELKAEIRIGQ